MRRARVIINPAAGAGRTARRWTDVTQALRDVDLAPDFVLTDGPGHATELAAHAARSNVDLVIAVGGDGTAHEVANGLLQHHDPPPLGLIQTGTGSDLTRVLALPRGIAAQAALIARAQPQPFDVGWCAHESPTGPRQTAFLILAGIGLSARVVQKSQRIKRLGRTLPYLLATCTELFSAQPTPAHLTLDDVRESLTLFDLAVLNVAWAGGGMHLAPGANPQDGRLEALITTQQSRWELLNLLLRLYNGAHVGRPGVRYGTITRARLEPEQTLPVALDGEVVGHTPAECWIAPGALMILAEEVRSQ
jgi:YegS/Rv2252/BmrU family lipid kinase